MNVNDIRCTVNETLVAILNVPDEQFLCYDRHLYVYDSEYFVGPPAAVASLSFNCLHRYCYFVQTSSSNPGHNVRQILFSFPLDREQRAEI